MTTGGPHNPPDASIRRDMRTDSDASGAPEEVEAPLDASPIATDRRHDAYAALRVPNYRRFIGGWVFASMGLQMQGMALGWEVYERTHSAFQLGLMGLLRALPVLVLALPAGQIVDMLDRKRVLIWTQVAFALVSAGIAAASYFQTNLFWLYVLVVLSGCSRVFNGPSRSSLLPQLVPAGPDGKTDPEVFHNAVTWNSGVFHFGAVAGPLLAGQVIAVMQAHAHANPGGPPMTAAAWPVYALTCLGCLVFAVSAAALKPRPTQRSDERLSLATLRTGMLHGARHVWHEKTILGAITLDLFAVLLGGATALLPIYAKDILHVGPVGLGYLTGAHFIGAVAMSLVLAHRPPFKHAGRTLLWSVAGYGVCIIVFGVSHWFWLSMVALVVSGLFDNVSVVVRHVLVQMRTPDQLRGRVSAVNSVFIESSNQLGAFESGVAAVGFERLLGSAVLGAIGSVVAGGIGTIIVVGLVAVWLPDLRRLGRLREIDSPQPPPSPPSPAAPPALASNATGHSKG